MELVHEIQSELAENPALELEEVTTCPFCHRPMQGNRCEYCGKKSDLEDEKLEQFIQQQEIHYDRDQAVYDRPAGNENDSTPFEQFANRAGTFHDYLMSNFLSTDYPPDMKELSEYLVYSIDDDGFLNYDEEFLKEKFSVTTEEILNIVGIIQTLEPTGIGASKPSEALLIQLDALTEEGKGNELAKRIISEHFEDLGKSKLDKIAKELEIPVTKVEETLDFIRRNLNPYPANAYVSRIPEPVILAKPSIAIKFDGKELSYEILELSEFNLRINSAYLSIYEGYRSGSRKLEKEEVTHIRDYFRRAKFFIDSVSHRKDVLDKIAQALIEEQSEFLKKGLPNFNTEITQGRLAEKIELHESTVSRAMSGKFVQIPTDEIVSFDFFFDSSVRPKEYIRNIIAGEDPKHPISDSDLRELLQDRGIDIARRTVAKYREEMRIPSSYERRRMKKHNGG